MAAKFTPLTLDLIDEGRFMKTVDKALRELQAVMVKHAEAHGELATGVKGKLSIEVMVRCDSPKDLAFTVKALTKSTVPGSPPSYSVAMGEEGDDDEPALFVRGSGSSKSHPMQAVLATQDGRGVNTDTGEVIA